MDDTSGSESEETILRTLRCEETMEDSSEEEIDNVTIRQKLSESGVIGRVLDHFMPCVLLHVIYNDALITLGDRLWLSQVQTGPVVEFYGDNFFSESVVYILVMTDADAPGGDYLHGLCAGNDADIDAPSQRLVDHEPPRTAGRMIVFTMFTATATQNIYFPITRENFSTRDFAARNAFGPPLAAAFFYIKNENEYDGDGDNESPRTDRNEKAPHSKIHYALPKPMDTRKILFNLIKPQEFQPTSVPSSLEKKTGNDVKIDSAILGTIRIRITYYNTEDNDSSASSTEQISCKHEDDDSPGKQCDDESATL